MLVRETAGRYNSTATVVEVVVDDFGASQRGTTWGIERYPAVWVGEVLFARPEDFYTWNGAGVAGRYQPWKDDPVRARFVGDLERLIDQQLTARGQVPQKTAGAVGAAAVDPADSEPPSWPTVDLFDRPLPPLPATPDAPPLLVVYATAPCTPCLEVVQAVAARVAANPATVAAVVVMFGLDPDQARRWALSNTVSLPVVMGPPIRRLPTLLAEQVGFPEVALITASGAGARQPGQPRQSHVVGVVPDLAGVLDRWLDVPAAATPHPASSR